MDILRELEHGAECFNSRKFWEAHEAWERVWRSLAEPGKTHLQSAIQVAGALHLQAMGRTEPARRLFQSALVKLVQTEKLVGDAPRVEIESGREILEKIVRGEISHPETIKAVVKLG